MEQFQFGLFPEGTDESGPALGLAERPSGLCCQVRPVGRAEIGQRVALEMPPDVLCGVQLRHVSRQPRERQAAPRAGHEVGHQAAAVGGEAVPDDEKPSPDLAQEVAEKADDLRGANAAAVESEIEPPPGHARDDGKLAPVEVERQLGRFADGCPGPGHGRLFAQAAFPAPRSLCSASFQLS